MVMVDFKKCPTCGGEIIYDRGMKEHPNLYPKEWKCLKCGRRIDPKQIIIENFKRGTAREGR